MPAQIWTPGQVLTAAELKTVTDMLPYPSVVSAGVNPCVAGTLYRCQPTGGAQLTMTLPAPVAGATIGFKLDALATAGSALIKQNASELIYGWALGATRGVASFVLTAADAFAVLISDGTNWHVIGQQPNAVPLFGVGSTIVGGTPPAGTRFLMQAGTLAGSTNAGASIGLTYPVAFPNGVVKVSGVPGDISSTLGEVEVIHSSDTLSGTAFACNNVVGSAINNSPVRINWDAIGW